MDKDESKPKMLYLMHVPWGWIKQRPHFIAEKLSQFFLLEVAEKKILSLKRLKELKNSNSKNLIIKNYFDLPNTIYNPFKRRNIVLDIINNILFVLSFRIYKYNYIWVTSIRGYYRIKDFIPKNAILIYDCMDDEFEFTKTTNNKSKNDTEKALIKRADYIFCTSEHLKQVVIRRTCTNKKIYLSNNATIYPDCSSKLYSSEKFKIIKSVKSIVYIGTIAEWFDIETILKILDDFGQLELFLIGPSEISVPIHDRIHLMGCCKHYEIWDIMRSSSILIMPFRVTPLIESVNPVKLYEYIWAEKPILAPKYKESEKFAEYVYLYDSYNELKTQIEEIIQNKYSPKSSISKIHQFTDNNSWDNRISDIIKVILHNTDQQLLK